MRAPETIPDCVRREFEAFLQRHPNVTDLSWDDVKWDSLMGCYFFTHAGVYFGIELDGHVHA